MLISAINTFSIYQNYSSNKQYLSNTSMKTLRCDSFQRSNVISFNGLNNIFTPEFFRKLVQEGIPCAYTGVELISKEDYRILTSIGSLRQPIQIRIDYLNKFEKSLYEFQKKILLILNKGIENSPPRNIHSIFKSKKHRAEKNLRIKQLNSLNRLLIEARELPQKDYDNFKRAIITYIEKLTEQRNYDIVLDPSSLSRKLDKIKFSDKKLKKKLERLIAKIPTVENSTDAYIMRFAKGRNSTQKSNNIATDILQHTICSNEHFWPQERYKAEHKENMFIIQTTHYVNQLKGNMTPDDFIRKYRRFKVKENMQAQVDRLIEIHNKWKTSDPKNANRLLKYILAYKYEIENRSNLVKIDIDDFIATIKSTRKGPTELKNADVQIRQMLSL